jgi:aldose sugar dehydrogenase
LVFLRRAIDRPYDVRGSGYMRATAGAAVVALALSLAAPASALPRGTEVETHKGGLSFPVDMAWVKGTKKIFFTEKNTGKIRVMVGRRLKQRACANLDVANDGEAGLLGIALHPDFARNKRLYVYFTNREPRENRVVRFTVRRNRCRERTAIMRGIAASSGYHNGGQLEFGGGRLFIAAGEVHDPAEAQDTTNRLGKILRVKPGGGVPADNPFGIDNPVWSYGHRNPFGLVYRKGKKILYETENGPSCDDELNIIRRARNYGWGAGYQCGTNGVGLDPKAPIRRWSNIIVPTDPCFYKGRMRRLSGDLYVPGFNGDLRRMVLNDRGTRVRRERVIHSGDGMIDCAKGPGGWLYFLTPSGIFRIVPR